MKRVALVTGGAGGIGFGISTCLAHNGFDLVISGRRNAEQVAESVDLLREAGADVLYCAGDVANRDDHRTMLAAAREHFGRLDVLVNNAGVAPEQRVDLLEATEESYDRVMNINLKGPFFLTQAAAKWMIEQQQADPEYRGCIINIGSISATVVSETRGDYCLSKAGVGMMNLLFASRMGEFDIPVFEIRPGIVKSNMTAGVTEKYDRLIYETDLCVLKRWGMPEDVGKLAVAMAQGEVPYATGQVVYLDGGMTIQRL